MELKERIRAFQKQKQKELCKLAKAVNYAYKTKKLKKL